MKRFSEAFFVVQNPRSSALSCCESVYSQYENVSTMLRCSKYLMNLPNLPVSCTALDGDVTNLPIIFEDKYQEDHTPRICAASALIRSSTYGDPKAESRRHSCSNSLNLWIFSDTFDCWAGEVEGFTIVNGPISGWPDLEGIALIKSFWPFGLPDSKLPFLSRWISKKSYENPNNNDNNKRSR